MEQFADGWKGLAYGRVCEGEELRIGGVGLMIILSDLSQIILTKLHAFDISEAVIQSGGCSRCDGFSGDVELGITGVEIKLKVMSQNERMSL